jgi:hypothetical protein
MIVDTATTALITRITNTSGSGSQSTSGFTLPNNRIIVLPLARYLTNHASGDATYTINGGSPVSFGAPISQGTNNDRIDFFVTRVVSGGTCVITLDNCSYDMCPPIILDGKSQYRVSFATLSTAASITEDPPASGDYPVSSNGVSPVWNTEIPANITKIHSSKVAIGAFTHGPDSGTPVVTPGGTWTTLDSVTDYDGTFQPGTFVYKQVPDNSAVTADFIIDQSFRYTLSCIIVEDTPTIYMVMGGRVNTGYFGSDTFGEESIGDVDFDPPLQPNTSYSPCLSLYGHTPDISLFSDNGGNTPTIKAQLAHDSEGGDTQGGSWTVLTVPVTTATSQFKYDGTSLTAGARGRYGQIGALVVETPDTSVGFQTITPVMDTFFTTQTITPGSSIPVISETVWGFYNNNRNHTDQLKPYTKPSGYTVDKLVHSEIDGDGPFSAIHDSDTQSGCWEFKYVTGFTTESPSWTYGGTAGLPAEARCMLVGFNIDGGTSPDTALFGMVSSVMPRSFTKVVGY